MKSCFLEFLFEQLAGGGLGAVLAGLLLLMLAAGGMAVWWRLFREANGGRRSRDDRRG